MLPEGSRNEEPDRHSCDAWCPDRHGIRAVESGRAGTERMLYSGRRPDRPDGSLNPLDASLLAAEAPRGGADEGDTEDSNEHDLLDEAHRVAEHRNTEPRGRRS